MFFAHSNWLLKLGISSAIHWFTSSSTEGASDAKLVYVSNKVASQFAAITDKEISQTIKQAVPEIQEGDKSRFGSLALSVWLEFIDETSEKMFCLQMPVSRYFI